MVTLAPTASRLVDMTVGGGKVEVSIVVDIQKCHTETEPATCRNRQPDRSRGVDEDAAAQVLLERRRLMVEVSDGQVEPAVAIVV